MKINEYVRVDTSESGSPAGFSWRGVTYRVVSAPEPWIGRTPWWVQHKRVPRGSYGIDVPMWRVDAVALTGPEPHLDGTFDLCFEPELGAWSLINAWNDVLDQQLFA